jgi:hypothetical protein
MTTNLFTRLIRYSILSIALCALAIVVISSVYYAQTQGVCLKSARVLSKDELRGKVLVNVVNHNIKELFQYNMETGNDYFWVGVNSPALETEFRKLVNASFNNGKSFEENFGLKVVLAGRNKGKYKTLTSDQLVEPFISVTYEPRSNGTAMFFSSDEISEVAFSELSAKQKEAAKSEITVTKKFLGYGNHYFYFNSSPFFGFERECCDNRDQDSDDYLDKKRAAYDRTLSAIDSNEENSPYVVAVSNCGDIWLTKINAIHLVGEEDWLPNEE